jgi:hypothetical protein
MVVYLVPGVPCSKRKPDMSARRDGVDSALLPRIESSRIVGVLTKSSNEIRRVVADDNEIGVAL